MIQSYSDQVETRLRVLAQDLRGERETVVVGACLTVAGATIDRWIKARPEMAPAYLGALVDLIGVALFELHNAGNDTTRES